MNKLSHNLVAIAQLLSDNNYHDGTSIGAQLNITRAAVWKAIKKLQAHGITIESVKGKGYALASPLLLLNAARIQELLHNSDLTIEVFEYVNSTNDYLKSFSFEPIPRICIAETQTQGKARLQRSWQSPFGQNIYLSLAYSLQKDISELAGLSLVTSLSLCQTLNNLYSLPTPISIKWPNDLLVDQRKLAGILIEIQAESHGYAHAIIGIGLNVNMTTESAPHIDKPWTSLRELTHTIHDRNILCATLIDDLIENLQQFERHGLNPFAKRWQTHDILYNKRVHLQSGTNQYLGIASGISPQGHLILQLDDGSKRQFAAGDTTIIVENTTNTHSHCSP